MLNEYVLISKSDLNKLQNNQLDIIKKLDALNVPKAGVNLEIIDGRTLYTFSEIIKLVRISRKTLERGRESGSLKVNKDNRTQVLGYDLIRYLKRRLSL